MGFLSNMTAMKAMILLCLIGACVLGYMGFKERGRVAELRDYLALDDKDQHIDGKESLVEIQAREIQQKAAQYTELRKELEGDNLAGDNNPLSYIRGIAGNRLIKLGGVNISPRENPERGYTDNIYTITPKALSSGSRTVPTFQRTQLANFMYKLEEGSKRVRVTSFRIDTPKPIKAEQLPEDKWSFQCAITMRTKS